MAIQFVGSFELMDQLPQTGLPEFVFVGRSNVGKSSLINLITNHKNLAHTSSTPGKTRLMNYYSVDQRYYIVDLPGYGYARLSKTERQRMGEMIDRYLAQRGPLFLVFQLLDIRVEPQESDMNMLQQLGQQGIPVTLVFTKLDKLKPLAIEQSLQRYRDVILEQWEEMPPCFMTSSHTGEGREALLHYISECLDRAPQA